MKEKYVNSMLLFSLLTVAVCSNVKALEKENKWQLSSFFHGPSPETCEQKLMICNIDLGEFKNVAKVLREFISKLENDKSALEKEKEILRIEFFKKVEKFEHQNVIAKEKIQRLAEANREMRERSDETNRKMTERIKKFELNTVILKETLKKGLEKLCIKNNYLQKEHEEIVQKFEKFREEVIARSARSVDKISAS